MRTNKIHRVVSAGLGVLACLVVAQTSEARKIQGFEAGDPAFTKTGDAGNQGTYQGEAPQEGSVQFLITTINTGANEDGATPQSGISAVPFSTLNSFFFNTTIANQTGSGLLIPFTFLAGDTSLTFQYDFLSNEPNNTPTAHPDFAFEALFNPGTSSLVGSVTHFATASAASPSLLFGAGSPFIFHTGYQTFTISLSGLGLVAGTTYDLGLGVADGNPDSNHASGLLVDNILIVPEPSTVGLGIAGAVLMVALRSRIKRKS